MRKKTLLLMVSIFFFNLSIAQNPLIDQFLTATKWNELFPKRAGVNNQNQGYTYDFYSYANFKQAVTEMADYKMKIRKKPSKDGEIITVTKKSTNQTYEAKNNVGSDWHTSPITEVITDVDFLSFANLSNTINNKRELAAFLANISKETTGGWGGTVAIGNGSEGDYTKWGLHFVREDGHPTTNSHIYSESHATYPPTPNKYYYGRGPIQLSYNYNYGPFSQFLYNNKQILLDDPDRLHNDGVLAFKSAIWFWMTPQWPKPSCHQAMQELWQPLNGEYGNVKMNKKGFAHTNNIINGGVECRYRIDSSTGLPTTTPTIKPPLRAGLYKYYLSLLGFTTTQIASEDSGNYTTLCYESASNTMTDYLSAYVTLSTENFNMESFFMYPNPVLNELTFEYNEEISKIEIYNIVGQPVISKMPNSLKANLDLSNLANGNYIVKVSSVNGKATLKIVKQ